LDESNAWFEGLNDALPEVQVEKHAHEISKICERARSLLKEINGFELPDVEILTLIKEMHTLDGVALTWRNNPNWAFKTIPRRTITPNTEVILDFPESIQLHRDVWIAYEWNYHRTARIIMHTQLLACVNKINLDSHHDMQAAVDHLRQKSTYTIQNLTDEILSTVPQSLGDIDSQGNIIRNTSTNLKCKGIGGYFLLWPIKIIKSHKSVTVLQQDRARATFERIRECTGMKSALGDLSCI
jgi:hypothetical protein